MVRVKHKEWKNDFYESFFKAGGTAGIQAEGCRRKSRPGKTVCLSGAFFIHRKLRPMNEKALRAGSHCVGVELCRWSNPPQAENPAKQDSFLVYRNIALG